jgi:FAD/FMN-containing dehydrogenase
MSNAAALLEFFKTNDRLRYVTPDSPDYTSLRTAYSLESIPVPIGIARPQNARDVSDIVSFAVSKGVAITVRSGGFDLSGRCYAQDALCIDVRDINYVKVNDSNTAATIGGGVSLGDVGRALSKLDLVTPLGSVPRIGYTGWATHGGYSMMEGNFGMGVDQILAAKIVNYEGKIVEADTQMLQVLRGGGGTLGVVVELTIKVYSLDKVLYHLQCSQAL